MDARKARLVEAETVARILTRKSGSSFYWAMRLLPKPKRKAMYAIYAFCRIVDDIADGAGSQAEKLQQLNGWRKELENVYGGNPQKLVSLALAHPVQEYGLNKEDFLAVITGMERDAGSRLRISDNADLETYCDQVACSVGRLANQVFGADRQTGNAIAASLGMALQLTNILRDISEDSAIDRIYLPRDLLLRHGIDGDDPVSMINGENFAVACDELARMAEGHFETAAGLITDYGQPFMRPAVLMMQTYRLILRRLQQGKWRNIDRRVRLSGPEKLLILLRYGILPL